MSFHMPGADKHLCNTINGSIESCELQSNHTSNNTMAHPTLTSLQFDEGTSLSQSAEETSMATVSANHNSSSTEAAAEVSHPTNLHYQQLGLTLGKRGLCSPASIAAQAALATLRTSHAGSSLQLAHAHAGQQHVTLASNTSSGAHTTHVLNGAPVGTAGMSHGSASTGSGVSSNPQQQQLKMFGTSRSMVHSAAACTGHMSSSTTVAKPHHLEVHGYGPHSAAVLKWSGYADAPMHMPPQMAAIERACADVKAATAAHGEQQWKQLAADPAAAKQPGAQPVLLQRAFKQLQQQQRATLRALRYAHVPDGSSGSMAGHCKGSGTCTVQCQLHCLENQLKQQHMQHVCMQPDSNVGLPLPATGSAHHVQSSSVHGELVSAAASGYEAAAGHRVQKPQSTFMMV